MRVYKPKISKPSIHNKRRGGRLGTSMAQRNASRRNIRYAQIARLARRPQ